MIAGTGIGPGASFGFGVFGQKSSSQDGLRPVTVYEVNSRQKRKPGVGLSLKF